MLMEIASIRQPITVRKVSGTPPTQHPNIGPVRIKWNFFTVPVRKGGFFQLDNSDCFCYCNGVH